MGKVSLRPFEKDVHTCSVCKGPIWARNYPRVISLDEKDKKDICLYCFVDKFNEMLDEGV